MIQRFIRITLLACLVHAGAVAAQVERDADTDTMTRESKPQSADEASLSVAEAVELARDAIDRMMDTEDPAVADEASAVLDRAYAIVKARAPDDPWLSYIAAGVFRRKGQDFDAVTELERFVNTRDGKNEWKAHRILGDLVIEGNFPRLARSHYQDAASLKQDEPSIFFGLSRCASAIGDYAEALDYAKKAVLADRRASVQTLNHLAQLARINKEWSTASAAASDALNLAKRRVQDSPGEIDPLTQLEAQYQIIIDTEHARLTDERDPKELTRGYLQLVEYTRQRGDVITRITKHNVVRALEAAEDRLGGDTPIVILEQAVVALTEALRKDDAAEVCRRILEQDPQNALATQWLEQHGTRPAALGEDDQRPPAPDSP